MLGATMPKKLSFQFSIFIIFLILILTLSTTISYNFYQQSTKSNLILANHIAQETSNKIVQKTINFFLYPSILPEALIKIINLDPEIIENDDILKIMLEDIKLFPQIKDITLIDYRGRKIQVIANPKARTNKVYRSTQNNLVQKISYLDKNYKLIKENIQINPKKPTQELWFKKSKDISSKYVMNLGELEYLKQKGLNIIYPISYNGHHHASIKIGISIVNLSELLSRESINDHGLVLIIDKNNSIIARPNYKKVNNKISINEIQSKGLFNKFKHILKKNTSDSATIIHNNKMYFGFSMLFPEKFKNRWKTLVIFPYSYFLSFIDKLISNAIWISIFIIFLSIIISLLVSKKISKPLKQITSEMKKISDFDIENIHNINSIFIEISNLSKSLIIAKKGLSSFKKYVPETLVRKLIKQGISPNIGGDKQELSIMFTDIEGFTHLSEKMKPETIMAHLSEYINELTIIIMEQNGTIDKYIGDAIMAFWGAPITLQNPCLNICDSAILCQRKISELNIKWKNAGLPLMNTRMGIHIGDTVVGNIGSNNRMNYTIIGDSVNLASRLEQINKYYGTNIIISHDIYKKVKNYYHTRTLDKILVKGKTESVVIYELIENKKNTINLEEQNKINKFEDSLKYYFDKNWDKSLNILNGLIKSFPNDKSIHLFINRCNSFKSNPKTLPDKWDGTTIFTEK